MERMNPCAKVITGPLYPENKTASDWGSQGLIAYGCYGYAVVIDPVTLQVIQTLGPHSGSVTQVRWSGEDYHHAFATGSTYSLHLATADSNGAVVIWDVATGQIRTDFSGTKSQKPVIGLEWYTGHDESHDLLMVLRSPDTLELWDAFSGMRLWVKQFGEQLLSFALDPFDIQRLIVLCENSYLYVLSDVNAVKGPSDRYKEVQITELQPNTAGLQRRVSVSERSLPRNSSSLTKMASLATNILSGPELSKKKPSVSDDDFDLISSCKQIVFNPAHKHIILLVYASEIHMIDLDVELTIGMIRLDKSSPNFVKVLPCRNADMLYCLHDNGSVSVRVRKQMNNADKIQSKGMLDMTYDLVCQSDSLRLLRHCKVYAMVHHPISEKQVALILSDSRVITLDVFTMEYSKPEEQHDFCNNRPVLSMADMISSFTIMSSGSKRISSKGHITLRMAMSGLVSGITSPVTALARKQDHIVAVGSGIGTVQLVNIHSGQVENEYKLFMSPLRGLLWINMYKLLAYTYPDPPSYGNRAVKSDIVILDVVSGKVVPLFEGVDKKGPIQKVAISASRNYCVVVFRQGPMELWNLRIRQMIRELVIDELIKAADVVWYPYIALTKKVKVDRDGSGKERKTEKTIHKEQLFICGQIDGGVPIIRVLLEDGIYSGMTCFSHDSLFEGQNQKAEVVKLAWKKKTLVLADRGGQLLICDAGTKTNVAKKFSDRHGHKVEDIAFAPGNSLRFLVHYTSTVDVWEICDGKPEMLTSCPTLPSNLINVSWIGEENITMATEDACLHVFDLSRQLPTSPTENKKDDFFHVKDTLMKTRNSPVSKWKLSGIFSPGLMEPKQAFLVKYSLQCNIEPMNEVVNKHFNLIDSNALQYIRDSSTSTADRCYQVARLFGDMFDMKFWSLVQYASQGAAQDKSKLTDSEKPVDLLEWYSKIPGPVAETNDLVDLDLSSDLDTSVSSSNQRSDGDLEISWLSNMDRGRVLVSSFGEKMKCSDYKVYETARLDLHNKKRFDYRVKTLCTSRYISMCKADMAVQGLMETDTDSSEFKSDYLKACLSSCSTQHTGTSLSTIKLAATHLIVAGYLSDGVDLLCLIGKHLDACKYLISGGKWQEAVWLAKTSLSEQECLEIIYKWADHLWNNSQRMKAMLLMLSHGQFAATLHMLCSQRQFDTAALFLQACLEQNLLEKSDFTDTVFVEFSKLLTVTGYQSAVEHYCRLAGDKGANFLNEVTKN